MPGTILENLSGRKLSVLVAILLLCQLGCFLVGLVAPKPANSMDHTAIPCLDTANPKNISKTHWITRKTCQEVKLSDEKATQNINSDNIVFVVEMPLHNKDFSRWQQNLIGVLQFDVVYKHDGPKEIIIELTLDSKLAFSNKAADGIGKTPWQMYAEAEEKRYMDCSVDPNKSSYDGYLYSCSMVPLFELGCLYHDYFLLNMRLPYDLKLKKNTELRTIDEVHLHAIHMNGGYTMIWVCLKTFFFPVVIGVIAWFWRRVHMLSRTPALLECMLLSLGSTLAFLDLPIEYLSLHFEMPYMLLLSDIRQGIFHAMLLSFWLVFAGEHMLIQDNGEKNSVKLYWKHLSTIVIGCLSLLIFDFCERGIQLVNPFFSIWVTPIGANLALSFIILAGISASMYFVFLCYMIWRVFRNISIKRSVLPSMSQARRLHYEGIIYRFNFLMLATVICAAMTVISYILGQISEGHFKWDELIDLDLSSALHTGVYGMWNVYICAMLMLYAPSHKQWPSEANLCQGDDGEEVEFNRLPADTSVNEISSLTSFASKASIE